MGGLEPPRLTPPDPKSGAATITPHPRFFRGRKSTLFFDTPKLLRYVGCMNVYVRERGVKKLPSVSDNVFLQNF